MNWIPFHSRPWARRVWLGAYYLVLALTIWGLVAIVAITSTLVDRFDDVQANAEVIAVEADEVGGIPTSTPSLRFTTESGDVIETEGQEVYRTMLVGEAVKVRYDPSRPDRVHYYPGLELWMGLVFWVLITFLLPFFALLARQLSRTAGEPAVPGNDARDPVSDQRSSTDQ